MSLAKETEMRREDIDEFVGNRETGVLTLAKKNEPYSIPISYGYDATDGTFYMRLVSTPESEKRTFLDSSPEIRLVIYDGTDDQTMYRSVVAAGTLEERTPEDLSVTEIEQYGEAKRPLFEIWGKGRDELDIKLYEFQPDTIEGRQTEIERDD
ncbi:pyridoxamine 5'-phosphate oxidase family protein [Halovenus rubra]|uniref:Pyridoxamine 5'-phosphate oxidase family protein n=2 Tax=Halovenus rubra TaxID=869890 RepID=A0ABD5X708_9EURY|nr:pyridoxamine 5'-phosphate oxidase family protein [Halovenus rubra]